MLERAASPGNSLELFVVARTRLDSATTTFTTGHAYTVGDVVTLSDGSRYAVVGVGPGGIAVTMERLDK